MHLGICHTERVNTCILEVLAPVSPHLFSPDSLEFSSSESLVNESEIIMTAKGRRTLPASLVLEDASFVGGGGCECYDSKLVSRDFRGE